MRRPPRFRPPANDRRTPTEPGTNASNVEPGYSISRLVKGGWHLAGGHGTIDRDQAIRDMASFVEKGITTFDCADHYVGVEELIGEFRARYPSLAKTVQVHTKFVPDLEDLPRLDRAYVVRIIDRSLQRLRVERLDLVQYFWWDFAVPGAVDAALALDDLRREGKIARLGVTNFNTTQFARLSMPASPSSPISCNTRSSIAGPTGR